MKCRQCKILSVLRGIFQAISTRAVAGVFLGGNFFAHRRDARRRAISPVAFLKLSTYVLRQGTCTCLPFRKPFFHCDLTKRSLLVSWQ